MLDLRTVTIVVLTWNSAATLERCLRSAVTQGAGQVLVLDNGSADGSAELAEGVEGVEVVRLPVNLGFAGGQVAALPHSRGELLVLLNADAELLEDAVPRMIRHFDGDSVAVVGCRSVAWDDDDFPSSSGADRVQVHPFTAHTRLLERTGEVRDVNSVSGAAMAIRRAALEEVGGFDTRFFAYYEETDLCARLKRAGWRVVTESAAVVRHVGASSLGQGSPEYLRLMTRNRFWFACKNFDPPFWRRFLVRYFSEELAAASRSGWTPAGRARVRGVLEAIVGVPWVARERRRVLGHGSYSERIVREEPPSVAVVIANYNMRQHVMAAVRSALTQTLPVAEVVVVDDGSTDDSVSALREAGRVSSQLRVIEQKNQGAAAARNAGAKATSAEWLIFLDADDELEPSYVEKCWCAVLAAHGRVGVVTTGVSQVVDEREHRTTPPRHGLARLAIGNYIHVASILRREAFEEVGGFSPEMSSGYEDWDLFLGIAERGWRILRVKEPLLRYRMHPMSRNVEAARHERELRLLLRQRHVLAYQGSSTRIMFVFLGTTLARVRAVLNDAARGDLDALAQRARRRA